MTSKQRIAALSLIRLIRDGFRLLIIHPFLPAVVFPETLSWAAAAAAAAAADQATLQERKRDSIKAAEKHKVKEELKQEAKAKAAKQTKHARDGAGADRDNDSKEGGDATDKAEGATAKRSRLVLWVNFSCSTGA